MRPLVVLGLVLASVAALILALFGLTHLRSSSTKSPAEAVTPADRSQAGRTTPDEALQSGSAVEETGSRVLADPVSAPHDRIEVGTAPGSYQNLLHGLVTGPDGNPVIGAQVLLRQQEGPLGPLIALQQVFSGEDSARGQRKTTGQDGTYEFRGVPPANNYALIVSHKDFQRRELSYIDLGPSGERIEDVQLGYGFRLTGSVTDLSGQGIPDAHLLLDSVVYFGLPSAHSPELIEAVTDVNGWYQFTNVEGGTRNLTCVAKGYGTRIAMNINFSEDPNKPIPAQDFRLEPGHRIRGRILAPSRAAVANARIEVFNYDANAASRGVAASDAAGNFTVEDLSGGQYMLTARAPGYSDERVNRVEVDGPPLEINMAQQGCVQGHVVDSATGTPLSSFTCAVRMVSPGTTVYGRAMQQGSFAGAKDGFFEVCGLEPGTYVVQASAADYAPTYSDTFQVTQGMTTPDISVRISRGGVVKGRVVDAHTGEPCAGAEIGTFDNGYMKNPFTDLLGPMMPRNTTQAMVRTDKEGRFQLSSLTPEVYQLEIVHRGHSTLQLKDVRLNDGTETDLGTIEMQVGASIRGTVYGADGQPVPNASINVRGNLMGRVFNARCGTDGRFLVESVPEGTYSVSAMRSSGQGEDANPFATIIDMKQSETSITVGEGGEHTLDLYLGKH